MARRQAKRGNGSSSHGLIGFALGVVVGLGLATAMGLMRSSAPPEPGPQAQSAEVIAPAEEELAPPRRYEFFSVLPEVERVVPEREIEQALADVNPEPTTTYTLQAGSFRSSADAESLRAQITLLGLSAQVQSVTVDDESWHRVRVGPFDSARAADGARRRLQDNGMEALVLSGN
mgnify:FL=1